MGVASVGKRAAVRFYPNNRLRRLETNCAAMMETIINHGRPSDGAAVSRFQSQRFPTGYSSGSPYELAPHPEHTDP
jgi:hypothetical protein